MTDEQRSLVATVLVIVVWIGWFAYTSYTRPPVPPPDQSQGIGQAATAPVDGDGSRSAATDAVLRPDHGGSDSEALAPAPAVEDELLFPDQATAAESEAVTFSLRTKELLVDFSSAGAALTQVKLLNHTHGCTADDCIILGNKAVLSLPVLATGVELQSSIVDADHVWEPVDEFIADIELNGTNEQSTVAFFTEVGSIRIDKWYKIPKDGFVIEVGHRLTNRAGGGVKLARLNLTGGVDLVNESSSYFHIGPATWVGGEVKQLDLDDLGDKPRYQAGDIRWSAISTQYFLASAILPAEQSDDYEVAFGSHTLDKDQIAIYQTFYWPQMQLSPGTPEEIIARAYFGPKDIPTLRDIDDTLDKSIDFGWFGGLARFFLAFLRLLHSFGLTYGIAIIVMTIIVRSLMYPLTKKSMVSMRKMGTLSPKMKELQEKYKDDKERLNQEMMNLYKNAGVNPASGCLPMLLQFPVFIGLYQALYHAVELRCQGFLWITDLSDPEHIWGTVLFGYDVELRILPLIMGVTMFIQQQISGANQQNAAQPEIQKVMKFMPVFFTFLFYGFPSGLVLYWLVSNVLGIIQQYFINKGIVADGESDNAAQKAASASTNNTEGDAEIDPAAKKKRKKKKK